MYNRGYPFYTFSGVIVGFKQRTIVNRSKDIFFFFFQKPEKIFSAFLLKGSKKCKYEKKNFVFKRVKIGTKTK